MKGKHFHTEWSFVAQFTKCGKEVRSIRYLTDNNIPFKTEDEALACMHRVLALSERYIQETGGHGKYDAINIKHPVRRIVTEWEEDGL